MNIRLFSEPYAAYFSPLMLSTQSSLGHLWWQLQHLFADQKFMAIFSMLFGASTALICDKRIQAGQSPYGYYFKRLLILLAFGLVHAYLIWHGDILVYYAVCGVIPLLFVRAPAGLTLLCGLAILAVGSINSLTTFAALKQLPEHILFDVITQHFAHTALIDQAELDAFSGSWFEQLTMRAQLAKEFHLSTFPAWGVFRVSGLMLIGLALYRLGFISGHLSRRFYGYFALCAIPAGIAMSLAGLWFNHQQQWLFPDYFFKHVLWNYWGSVLTACGYMALLAYISLRGWLSRLRGYLSLVGRMALSNYLLQSLLCSVWFYGLGFYANTGAVGAILTIATVWMIQLGLSKWWLMRYPSGPAELLWRTLSGR
ncbi:hypothetical protein C3B51_21875 [Pseudoalteromonas rubra]|uniref:DUF418 domain-containing protein n=2 Tax=Pseudoalteromonas rubra TaxID=43658 RepID=A0A4Q7DYL3_9GAMM|nr:hypothetical protein C3B51_21875 [Pseudoalteromonas rubra]